MTRLVDLDPSSTPEASAFRIAHIRGLVGPLCRWQAFWAQEVDGFNPWHSLCFCGKQGPLEGNRHWPSWGCPEFPLRDQLELAAPFRAVAYAVGPDAHIAKRPAREPASVNADARIPSAHPDKRIIQDKPCAEFECVDGEYRMVDS